MTVLSQLKPKEWIQGTSWCWLIPWINSLGSSCLRAATQGHPEYKHTRKLCCKCECGLLSRGTFFVFEWRRGASKWAHEHECLQTTGSWPVSGSPKVSFSLAQDGVLWGAWGQNFTIWGIWGWELFQAHWCWFGDLRRCLGVPEWHFVQHIHNMKWDTILKFIQGKVSTL